MAELRPLPLAALLRRALAEHRRSGALFDLAADKHHHGAVNLDLSIVHHGRMASTPVGPAAGPHSQLAQNILLCWLGGARVIELRTVQGGGPAVVQHPCIDAGSVVFHRESAQELSLEASAREYVKAAMLLQVLQAAGITQTLAAPRPATLFEVSLGYDAASVRSAALGQFIASLTAAQPLIEELRRDLDRDLAPFADLDFDAALCQSVTLRTRRDCPAADIGIAARHLLEHAGVDLLVELNPAWLGQDAITELLHDQLGYRHIQPLREPVRQLDEALALVQELGEIARAAGRRLGVRIGGSLQVLGQPGAFPGAATMSMAGRPLYPLALSLALAVREALGPELQIGFAGGIDAHNVCDVAASDLRPIGVVSDLLRPGGYGRMSRQLEAIETRMRQLGAPSIAGLVERTARATAAGSGDPSEDRLSPANAALTNLRRALDRALDDPRYRYQKDASSPRKIGSQLQLFDCVSCDKCVPTCPNDANFVYHTAAVSSLTEQAVVAPDGAIVVRPDEAFIIERRHQLACYADLCNDCGNCEVFCPEDGGPQRAKPRLFGSPESFAAHGSSQGYYLTTRDAQVVARARINGRAVELWLDRSAGVAHFTDGIITLRLGLAGLNVERAEPAPGASPQPGHTLSTRLARTVLAVVDGVLDPARPNPVNSPRS